MPTATKADELRTVSIHGVEIFAAGTWNGHEYTNADLDAMVSAFSELRGKLDPPVKLGHDDGQKLLQQDGYPAAGWVSALRRTGDKLVADLRDVPAKLAELIKAGAYRKVSAEIYWNYKEAGKTYRRVLKAIALLGGDIPAVSSIGDIRALYGEGGAVVGYYDDEGREVHVVSFDQGNPVTLEELDRDIGALIANADTAIKNRTGAPAMRAFLREVQAKLRKMMGIAGAMPKPKEMPDPDGDMPEESMPKRHSLQLFKTEVNYRTAEVDGDACAGCRWYWPPPMGDMGGMGKMGGAALGAACQIVEGLVLDNGVCDRYEAMPEVGGGMAAHAAAAVTKTEDGESYPAAAYLVVPDPEKPSTWKLRVWESPAAKVTRAQLGRAAAAFSPGGFRGQPVQLAPDEEKQAKAKLRSLYRGLGAGDDEIPDYLTQKEEAMVTEAQFSELQGKVETLTNQLATAQGAAAEATAKLAAAEATAKTYQDRIGQLETSVQVERDTRRYSEIVQLARRWEHVPGKPEDIATRLQKLERADPAEYEARVAEYDQMEQVAVQSGLFREVGSSRTDGGGSAEARLNRMAEARMAERKIDYATALGQVAAENPQLHRQYTRETAVRV